MDFVIAGVMGGVIGLALGLGGMGENYTDLKTDVKSGNPIVVEKKVYYCSQTKGDGE